MTLKVFADRGGTFTDIVAITNDRQIAARVESWPDRFQVVALPDNQWVIVTKLLSEQPERYRDAVIQGIRDILGLAPHDRIPPQAVAVVKMGTTVATNALLERKGDRTLLLINEGLGDALRIGYQNRPQIFAREIILPEMLYERVIEVRARYSAQGEELIPITAAEVGRLTASLQTAYADGIRACAIAFIHGYRYPDHELQVANLARSIGFTQVSISHAVSPLMKLVSRGDTTVVDAYLSPILRRYVAGVAQELPDSIALELMKSDGGLTAAHRFQGKDSILSGPAGGIVGAVKTSNNAGFDRIIGFDMGGTSTDVSHFNGRYERTFETEVAGVRLRTPMMAIHTIAAGGGSLLQFDGARYRVGPQSAGAYPGPACYRQGGDLTITDANVMVGKIQPDFFPQVFGAEGNLPIDRAIVAAKFTELTATINAHTGDDRSPVAAAAGFLDIAIDKMAKAIEQISVRRGYDVTEYALCCFGGAGGQHACLLAEALGMSQIFIHPYAGVLSAYGMGLADLRTLQERSIELPLTEDTGADLDRIFAELKRESLASLVAGGAGAARVEAIGTVHLGYEGADTTIAVEWGTIESVRSQFESIYHQQYGFAIAGKALIVKSIAVEAIAYAPPLPELLLTSQRATPPTPAATVRVYTKGQWHSAPVYRRADLQPGDRINGAALIVESTGTNAIEPGWCAELTPHNCLILRRDKSMAADRASAIDRHAPTKPDPVLLEIFNNLLRSIAEEMGIVLQNTSYSVNIKERLDFSCAIFDRHGQLIANAPHIPVHLGSMSESVTSLIRDRGASIAAGDVYIANNPYNGGTHLPDITVITPVFIPDGDNAPCFYVASRGHHADIGGITPGSMPPASTHIEEEGILFDNFQLVAAHRLQESELRSILTTGKYPARNPDQNLADLQAQIAANERGIRELGRIVAQYGLPQVEAYMEYVRDNAESSVRRAIEVLRDGSFTYPMDDGVVIQVNVQIDRQRRSARIDFTGTSPQQPTNLNAPLAICKAVVLYVFRTLVDDDIPLNAGCLAPLEIIVPAGCLLDPRYPAPVVAGNVETSQAIANALYGALGITAASQGTMNNFTFGNDRYQYYETICGGSGAGASFNGTDAVQTHMTNSRLTDPEVLEWRFPVLVERFAIRAGSGGSGRYQGGNGVIRRIRFRAAMTAAILSSHRIVPPFGLHGGGAGKIGCNSIERNDGTIELLPGCAEVAMAAGDVFEIATPGGGGYEA